MGPHVTGEEMGQRGQVRGPGPLCGMPLHSSPSPGCLMNRVKEPPLPDRTHCFSGQPRTVEPSLGRGGGAEPAPLKSPRESTGPLPLIPPQQEASPSTFTSSQMPLTSAPSSLWPDATSAGMPFPSSPPSTLPAKQPPKAGCSSSSQWWTAVSSLPKGVSCCLQTPLGEGACLVSHVHPLPSARFLARSVVRTRVLSTSAGWRGRVSLNALRVQVWPSPILEDGKLERWKYLG